jgi:hypothetical protein
LNPVVKITGLAPRSDGRNRFEASIRRRAARARERDKSETGICLGREAHPANLGSSLSLQIRTLQHLAQGLDPTLNFTSAAEFRPAPAATEILSK